MVFNSFHIVSIIFIYLLCWSNLSFSPSEIVLPAVFLLPVVYLLVKNTADCQRHVGSPRWRHVAAAPATHLDRAELLEVFAIILSLSWFVMSVLYTSL